MLSTLTLSALFIGTFSKFNIANHRNRDESLNHNFNKFKQQNGDEMDDGSDNMDDKNQIELHNSCINLDDGMFYIKPTEDGPVIPVICSKSYTMIDISLHFDNIVHYFSSYDYSKSDTYIIGPELDDMVSWREWWTIADDTYLFRTASNCHACYPDEIWESNAAYYMSSYYFCFSTAMEPECPDGIPNEGFDYNACAYCDDGKGKSSVSGWTKCTSLRFNVDTKPDTDHYNCVTHELVYRPSAVTNRDACTCYKESDKKDATTYWVKPSDLPPVTIPDDLDEDIIIDPLIIIANNDVDDADTEFADLPITYLTQDDFIGGTYRISERGEYILTENVIIAFNEPSDDIQNDPDFSPNAYDLDDLYWYPRHDQDEKYPGLYTYHGKFTLGFFAAISIETDDVIINLNGFSISMDYKFYFQQRFFSLIELGNQPFIGGQGPANWGMIIHDLLFCYILI